SRAVVSACGLWIVLGVCGLTLVLFPAFFRTELEHNSPVLGLNDGYLAIWLGIGLVLLGIYCLEKLARQPRGALVGGLIAAAIIAALAVALRYGYNIGTIEQDPFLFIIPILVAAFLTGAPIAIVLGLGGMLYFVVTGDAPLVAIPSAYQAGVNSYILLAVPF